MPEQADGRAGSRGGHPRNGVGPADQVPPADRAAAAERIDPAEWQASLDRMTAVLTDIMATVADVSTRRCPYKNRHHRCTASFGCRNQRRPTEPGGLRVCGGDERLDYRSAWEAGIPLPVLGTDSAPTAPAREELDGDPGPPSDAESRDT